MKYLLKIYQSRTCRSSSETDFLQKSVSLYKYGHERISEKEELNGGFATHYILKKGTSIYILPDEINDKVAAPMNCSHATIAGALRLAGCVKDKMWLSSVPVCWGYLSVQ